MVGIIFMICLLCCVIIVDLNKKEKTEDEDINKLRKAYRELIYEDHKMRNKFNIYLHKRKRGKLTYVIPEFEKRIVKMNKLKKKEEEIRRERGL